MRENLLDNVRPEYNINSHVEYRVEITLVLSGMELVCFIKACLVLSFGFVTKTLVITYWCFSCC